MPSLGSCRICAHARVLEINAELLSPNKGRRSLRGIAHLFAVNDETMRRHYHKCLGQAVSQEQVKTPQDSAQIHNSSFGFSQDLVARAAELNERAQVCGNPNLMLSITRELSKLIADLVQEAENQ